MHRTRTALLTCCLAALCCLCLAAPAPAAALKAKAAAPAGPSAQAQSLRAENDLIPFAPPEDFLAGNFVADEQSATRVFGTVKQFAASRGCPATWLIERGEKERLERLAANPDPKGPAEYTLTLEADCKGAVTHYSFVVWPGAGTQAWLDWRQRFHGRKAGEHYGPSQARLEKAAKDGCALSGELRFVSVNGQLSTARAEDALAQDPKIRQVYDLVAGQRGK